MAWLITGISGVDTDELYFGDEAQSGGATTLAISDVVSQAALGNVLATKIAEIIISDVLSQASVGSSAVEISTVSINIDDVLSQASIGSISLTSVKNINLTDVLSQANITDSATAIALTTHSLNIADVVSSTIVESNVLTLIRQLGLDEVKVASLIANPSISKKALLAIDDVLSQSDVTDLPIGTTSVSLEQLAKDVRFLKAMFWIGGL